MASKTISIGPVEKALNEATGIKWKEGTHRQKYLVKLIEAVNELDKDEWEDLSESAQDWFNKSVDANDKGNDLPEFNEEEEEPVKPRKAVKKAVEEDEPVKPKKGAKPAPVEDEDEDEPDDDDDDDSEDSDDDETPDDDDDESDDASEEDSEDDEDDSDDEEDDENDTPDEPEEDEETTEEDEDDEPVKKTSKLPEKPKVKRGPKPQPKEEKPDKAPSAASVARKLIIANPDIDKETLAKRLEKKGYKPEAQGLAVLMSATRDVIRSMKEAGWREPRPAK